MALLDMQDKISHAIDANEFSFGVFFDLAKASDTVDHCILLNKLENYMVYVVCHSSGLIAISMKGSSEFPVIVLYLK